MGKNIISFTLPRLRETGTDGQKNFTGAKIVKDVHTESSATIAGLIARFV